MSKRALSGALFIADLHHPEKLVQFSVMRYNPCMPKYAFFDHTADIGVEIFGRTKKQLFAHAAEALFDVLIEKNGQKSKAARTTKERLKIRALDGTDVGDLLINFLRELLYLTNGAGWVIKHCTILECSNKRLVVQLLVEPLPNKAYAIKTEIKAVTYSGLSVSKNKAGWQARVIFDV
jgi:SHS2 domain-containing protein